jgi:6,7-dimethyl-8-ribityllumazine synthase
MKIGIVVSEWYWEEITQPMLNLAVKTAEKAGVEVEVVKAPGSFDIPLPVKKLLQKPDIDAVVTLGAVIQGETDHDGVIGYTVAQALVDLSLAFEKPVMLGINGPKMSYAGAVKRIGRAAHVMEACIAMVKRCRESKK